MEHIESPAYYAIIPADVRYDKRLPANARLLYGEITALCNKEGYCWATNGYFAELYEVKNETVSRWISKLRDFGYIEISMRTSETSDKVDKRTISIAIDKKVKEVLTKKSTPLDKKVNTPLDKKVKENITSNNNTSNIKENIKKTAHTKMKFGTYQNVLLTADELERLKGKFTDYLERIEELSFAIESKGYKYKSHCATIESWARREAKEEAKKKTVPKKGRLTSEATYDIEQIDKDSYAETMAFGSE